MPGGPSAGHFLPGQAFGPPLPKQGGSGLGFGGIGAIIGGVIGAPLGAISAGLLNKRIQEVAARRMRRINEKVTQMRVNKIISMGALSRTVRLTLGDFSAAAQHNQAVTESLASRVVANAARDQDTIDVNLERGELAAEAEKEDIAATASSQTKNRWFAAIEGGLSGAATGASFGGAIDGAVRDGQLDAIARENGMGTVDIAKARTRAATLRAGAAGEMFNLTRATNARITSKIQRSSVRGTFDTVHLPVPGRAAGFRFR
jgi:hypothetical protein